MEPVFADEGDAPNDDVDVIHQMLAAFSSSSDDDYYGDDGREGSFDGGDTLTGNFPLTVFHTSEEEEEDGEPGATDSYHEEEEEVDEGDEGGGEGGEGGGNQAMVAFRKQSAEQHRADMAEVTDFCLKNSDGTLDAKALAAFATRSMASTERVHSASAEKRRNFLAVHLRPEEVGLVQLERMVRLKHAMAIKTRCHLRLQLALAPFLVDQDFIYLFDPRHRKHLDGGSDYTFASYYKEVEKIKRKRRRDPPSKPWDPTMRICSALVRLTVDGEEGEGEGDFRKNGRIEQFYQPESSEEALCLAATEYANERPGRTQLTVVGIRLYHPRDHRLLYEDQPVIPTPAPATPTAMGYVARIVYMAPVFLHPAKGVEGGECVFPRVVLPSSLYLSHTMPGVGSTPLKGPTQSYVCPGVPTLYCRQGTVMDSFHRAMDFRMEREKASSSSMRSNYDPTHVFEIIFRSHYTLMRIRDMGRLLCINRAFRDALYQWWGTPVFLLYKARRLVLPSHWQSHPLEPGGGFRDIDLDYAPPVRRNFVRLLVEGEDEYQLSEPAKAVKVRMDDAGLVGARSLVLDVAVTIIGNTMPWRWGHNPFDLPPSAAGLDCSKMEIYGFFMAHSHTALMSQRVPLEPCARSASDNIRSPMFLDKTDSAWARAPRRELFELALAEPSPKTMSAPSRFSRAKLCRPDGAAYNRFSLEEFDQMPLENTLPPNTHILPMIQSPSNARHQQLVSNYIQKQVHWAGVVLHIEIISECLSVWVVGRRYDIQPYMELCDLIPATVYFVSGRRVLHSMLIQLDGPTIHRGFVCMRFDMEHGVWALRDASTPRKVHVFVRPPRSQAAEILSRFDAARHFRSPHRAYTALLKDRLGLDCAMPVLDNSERFLPDKDTEFNNGRQDLRPQIRDRHIKSIVRVLKSDPNMIRDFQTDFRVGGVIGAIFDIFDVYTPNQTDLIAHLLKECPELVQPSVLKQFLYIKPDILNAGRIFEIFRPQFRTRMGEYLVCALSSIRTNIKSLRLIMMDGSQDKVYLPEHFVFMFISKRWDVECLAAILRFGVPIDGLDFRGQYTLLYRIVEGMEYNMSNAIGAVLLLQSHGYPFQRRQEVDALRMAVSLGAVEMCRILRHCGVDATDVGILNRLRDSSGHFPYYQRELECLQSALSEPTVTRKNLFGSWVQKQVKILLPVERSAVVDSRPETCLRHLLLNDEGHARLKKGGEGEGGEERGLVKKQKKRLKSKAEEEDSESEEEEEEEDDDEESSRKRKRVRRMTKADMRNMEKEAKKMMKEKNQRKIHNFGFLSTDFVRKKEAPR